MKHFIWIIVITIAALAAGCVKAPPREEAKGIMFKDDVAFLKQHTQPIVLTDGSGQAQVAVNPDLQGRVMTSTAGGPDGLSFGWINREFLATKQHNVHINAFGGEDRFWLGPEGGQFSIFFKKGAPFNLDNWFTPPPINEGAFDVVSQEAGRIQFRKSMHLVNYSGTEFDLDVERRIVLADAETLLILGLSSLPKGVSWVGYSTYNTVKNTGAKPWIKDTGLLSIWILGMFNPSPATTIVVPYMPGTESEKGPIVNDAYFGKVPEDRLAVTEGWIFFRGDGLYRSKIGISPRRALANIGSYDAANRVLTVVHAQAHPSRPYVNSMWEIQKDPFLGDAFNSYNDGPPSPGAKPLGPFYEIETSSPGLELKLRDLEAHDSLTVHFQGDEKALDEIAKVLFGVGLDYIKAAFKK